MRSSRDNYIDAQRRLATLIGSIGAVATALAAAGMFALVAFAVAQRKRELGIRIAIGARPRHVLSVLLTQNLRPTGLGIFAGVVLAIILFQLVRSIIVVQGRESFDLIGFAAGLAFFIAVAAVASLVPASRALRIDPSETLREE
jgi:ABC-type antimicrobial peptide transport system permease subunit